jgi:enoyl-CoA hydratase/carnithine racemase
VGKNPEAIKAAKRMANMLSHSTDEEILLAESAEQEKIIGQPNQLEAVMAQMEMRAPSFS